MDIDYYDELNDENEELGVIPITKKPLPKRPKVKKKVDNIRQARKDKQKRQQLKDEDLF